MGVRSRTSPLTLITPSPPWRWRHTKNRERWRRREHYSYLGMQEAFPEIGLARRRVANEYPSLLPLATLEFQNVVVLYYFKTPNGELDPR